MTRFQKQLVDELKNVLKNKDQWSLFHQKSMIQEPTFSSASFRNFVRHVMDVESTSSEQAAVNPSNTAACNMLNALLNVSGKSVSFSEEGMMQQFCS